MHQRVLSLLAAMTLSSAALAQGTTVNVVASDYTFEIPDSIPAGVTTFRLVNKGRELHHVQLARLEQGKTVDDLAAAMRQPGPPPSWLTWLGGPNATVPDGRSVSEVTETLAPGNYVVLCVIPGPDKVPHVMKGMMHPLRVTSSGPATQAGAPKADVILTLYDYNFDVSKPLTAGTHVIEVRNKAKQPHEAFLTKLAPGSTPTALVTWIRSGMQGPPPVKPMGGITGIQSGETNTFTVTLDPGEYVWYCFLPDATDGKEHVDHGMLKQFTVK